VTAYVVTGGCGFIGSHLVDALVAAGHAVITGDLRNPLMVERAMRDMDGCFHLAAVASVVRCNDHWPETHAINQSATVALFDAARRAPRPISIVYASSAAVYGDCPALPIPERAATCPSSPYGADKRGCELHAIAAAQAFGLSPIGLRFFNVYGPRQRPDDAYAGVISLFAARLRVRQTLTLFGDGLQARDFIFVGDVVEALLAAMRRLEQGGPAAAELFNVCTGVATTVRDLAQMLMRASGVHVPVKHAAGGPGDIRLSVGSPVAATEALGYRATTSLEQGLRITLNADRSGRGAAT
jgi:UDP-glucose 4-epimerase